MEAITAEEINAQFYDASVPENFWEGEADFYREMLAQSPLVKTHGVLELACGTGRISLALSRQGIHMTGLDLSAEMLEIARTKSAGMPNVGWVQGDMRSFDLGSQFGCVIVPAHSFQFMTTPDDQLKCLAQIKQHLVPGGLAVIHLDPPDIRWLADLIGKREDACKTGSILTHPVSGQKFRQTTEWTYEPSTQTSTCQNDWHRVDESGNILQTWKREPMRFHCFFRFEMEHLLRRSGFIIEALYGDFSKNALGNESPHMIWIAKTTGDSTSSS